MDIRKILSAATLSAAVVSTSFSGIGGTASAAVETSPTLVRTQSLQTFLASYPNRVYENVNSANAGHKYCMDIYGSSTANGANLIQYACTKTTPEQFHTNATSQLVNVHSGKCLIPYGGQNSTSSAKITQWSCINQTSQQWLVGEYTDGSIDFQNVDSGLCMNVYHSSTNEGADVVQNGCAGIASERWWVLPAPVTA